MRYQSGELQLHLIFRVVDVLSMSILDASVIDARLTWQFSLRSFLRMTIQHSEVDRNLSVYDSDVVDD